MASFDAAAQDATPPTSGAAPANGAAAQEPSRPPMTAAAPGSEEETKPPKKKTFLFLGMLSQTDFQSYFGPGVGDYEKLSGLGLDDGFRLKLNGIRLGGRIEQKWIFHTMAIVGRGGANGAQQPTNNPTVQDAWLGYEFDRHFRARVGQFQTPYTLDANEFYSPNADFLEPTNMTRFVTAPVIRPLGLMVWGDDPHFIYSAGYVNGAVQVTLNGPGDLIGRAALRPFGSGPNFIHIGGGARIGSRDPTTTFYDQPSLQNSTYQYNFWQPVYVTDLANEFHVIPSNQQRTFDLELLGALGRFEFSGEIAFAHQERREAQRAFLDRTVRAGTLSGITYYATAGLWILGPPRRPAASRGNPYVPPNDPPPSPLEGITTTPTSLQLATRWEQVIMDYNSNDRSPEVARGALDGETTRIRLNTFQVILNLFTAKHIRISTEWTTYFVPGTPEKIFTDCSAISCPGKLGNGSNQAIAPGAIQKGNISQLTLERNFTVPAANAQVLNQFITRFQVGF